MQRFGTIVFILGLYLFLFLSSSIPLSYAQSRPDFLSPGSVNVSSKYVGDIITLEASLQGQKCNGKENPETICSGNITVAASDGGIAPLDLSQANYQLDIAGTKYTPSSIQEKVNSFSHTTEFFLPSHIKAPCTSTYKITLNNVKVVQPKKTSVIFQILCMDIVKINDQLEGRNLVNAGHVYGNYGNLLEFLPKTSVKTAPTPIINRKITEASPSATNTPSPSPKVRQNETKSETQPKIKQAKINSPLETITNYLGSYFQEIKVFFNSFLNK